MLRRVIAIQRALPITLCRMNRTLRMKRKQRTQANEGTLLDPDGSSSSSSVPFPWSRFYLLLFIILLLLTEPAAHIIWRAAVPDLGLLTAARPPPDRSCLSPRVVFLFFLTTQQMSTVTWKRRRWERHVPILKTGPLPENTNALHAFTEIWVASVVTALPTKPLLWFTFSRGNVFECCVQSNK